LVKKFTNYRYHKRDVLTDSTDEKTREYLAAADALVDLKKAQSAKELFRSNMHAQIVSLRDELKAEDSKLSTIGAYQMATRILWDETDQSLWEEQAEANYRDIHQ
jgi:hypothetical protein